MERGGVDEPPVVPYEASAALSMLLLRDHGMLMVHFVGVPPGTADLLIKFVPPETLERFGGAWKYADAVNTSLTRLSELLREPEKSAPCCSATTRRTGFELGLPGSAGLAGYCATKGGREAVREGSSYGVRSSRRWGSDQHGPSGDDRHADLDEAPNVRREQRAD